MDTMSLLSVQVGKLTTGMVASMTTIPVIGVPIESKSLKRIILLLSIVQMPEVFQWPTAIGNAGAKCRILVARILSISNESVRKHLE